MTTGGITYGGEVIHSAPNTNNLAQRIEIPFEDENFLQRASNKKPHSTFDYLKSIVTGFADGAYSWPFDYMMCMNWIAGTAGFYGSRVREICNNHTRRILTVIRAARTPIYYLIFRGLLWKILNNETAMLTVRKSLDEIGKERLTQEFYDRLPTLAYGGSRLTGRWMSGAAFTAWMQTGGRIGATVSRGRMIGIASFNFVALMWGSALHASANQPEFPDVLQIFMTWITGDPNYKLSPEEYTELFRLAQEISEIVIEDEENARDYENFRDFIDTLVRFGEAGGRL